LFVAAILACVSYAVIQLRLLNAEMPQSIDWNSIRPWTVVLTFLWGATVVWIRLGVSATGSADSSVWPGVVLMLISCGLTLLNRRPMDLVIYGLTLPIVGLLSTPAVATAGAALFSGVQLAVVWFLAGPEYVATVALGLFFGPPMIYWLRREFRAWKHETRLYDHSRAEVAQLTSMYAKMSDDIDRAEGVSRIRERERVAREVHDTVGYTLSAVLMQIGVVRRMLATQPENLDTRLSKLEEMIRRSIQDVRGEVSRLRDDSVVTGAGRSRWIRLCQVFSESTGMRVHCDIPEELEYVSEELSNTLYRVFQESLTNAYRHGHADYVDITMKLDEERGLVLVRVSDNGVGGDTPMPGNGLTGMRERIESIGGSLAWKTLPGRGFDVGIDVPAKWKSPDKAAANE
jgi:signal transduction histidine kinase